MPHRHFCIGDFAAIIDQNRRLLKTVLRDQLHSLAGQHWPWYDSFFFYYLRADISVRSVHGLSMQRISWLGLILLCLSVSCLFTACVSRESRGGAFAPAPPPTPLQPIVSASFLAALEQELANEINLARTQPHTYAAFLGRSGLTATANPNGRGRVALAADRQALEEALAFLRSTVPLPPLAVSRGMSLGARDHVWEQGRTGAFGHQGGDGARVDARVNRYGLWQGQITENLSYGFDNARLMTVMLLIDEGIPDRSHRYNIFDAQARVLGVACGPHPATQIVCVMTFAEDYTEGKL